MIYVYDEFDIGDDDFYLLSELLVYKIIILSLNVIFYIFFLFNINTLYIYNRMSKSALRRYGKTYTYLMAASSSPTTLLCISPQTIQMDYVRIVCITRNRVSHTRRRSRLDVPKM